MAQPTLAQLRCLLAVAEALNFRKAAAACNLTQPALTAQIQNLEERLGAQLLERTRRKVLLTPIGAEVVVRARNILRETEQLGELARAAQRPLSGPLRLGVIPTLGPYLLPRILPRVREAFPALQLLLREDQTARLLERLRGGQLEAALLALPVDGPDLGSVALFDEPFLVALPPDHALARKQRVREADLAGEPVLLLEDGHCLRDQALAVCRLAGATEAPGLQATSLNTLAQMVANGIGLSLLPALAVDVEARLADRMEVRPFAGEQPRRRIGLVWRVSSARDSEYRILADFLRANLPESVAPAGASAKRGRTGEPRLPGPMKA